MNLKSDISLLVSKYINEKEKLRKEELFNKLYGKLNLYWFRRMISVASGGRVFSIDDRNLEEIKNDFFARLISEHGFNNDNKAGASFCTWANKVIYCLYIDKLKELFKGKRIPDLSLDDSFLNRNLKTGTCSGGRKLKQKFLIDYLEEVSGGINHIKGFKRRLVFVLHVIYDIDFEKVSELLKIKENTARTYFRESKIMFLESIDYEKLSSFIDFKDALDSANVDEYLELKVKNIESIRRREIFSRYFSSDKKAAELSREFNVSRWRILREVRNGLFEILDKSMVSRRLREIYLGPDVDFVDFIFSQYFHN